MEDTNAMRLGCNLFVMLQVCRDSAEQCHHGPALQTLEISTRFRIYFRNIWRLKPFPSLEHLQALSHYSPDDVKLREILLTPLSDKNN